jgi:hypothetical protein
VLGFSSAVLGGRCRIGRVPTGPPVRGDKTPELRAAVLGRRPPGSRTHAVDRLAAIGYPPRRMGSFLGHLRTLGTRESVVPLSTAG